MRILVGTDGSECSDLAVDRVAERPWPVDSQVRLVTAVDPWPGVGTEAWELPADYTEALVSEIPEEKKEAAGGHGMPGGGMGGMY